MKKYNLVLLAITIILGSFAFESNAQVDEVTLEDISIYSIRQTGDEGGDLGNEWVADLKLTYSWQGSPGNIAPDDVSYTYTGHNGSSGKGQGNVNDLTFVGPRRAHFIHRSVDGHMNEVYTFTFQITIDGIKSNTLSIDIVLYEP